MLRMRVLTAVAPSLDVASAGQDQTVDPLYQVDPILLPFVIGEEDGEGARCEQRAPVPVSVVVTVVGEALRDRDQRAADQVRTPTVVSNQASNIRLP